jgi:hypothetical protein
MEPSAFELAQLAILLRQSGQNNPAESLTAAYQLWQSAQNFLNTQKQAK